MCKLFIKKSQKKGPPIEISGLSKLLNSYGGFKPLGGSRAYSSFKKPGKQE